MENKPDTEKVGWVREIRTVETHHNVIVSKDGNTVIFLD